MNDTEEALPPMATTVDERAGVVIYGVAYPRDPRDMTAEEIRGHLFLPEETSIEVLDHQDEGDLTEVGISWDDGVDGTVVLDHVKRIIRERMLGAV